MTMPIDRHGGASAANIAARLRTARPAQAEQAQEHDDLLMTPPNVVRSRLKARAILPSALAVACAAHSAPAGVRCFEHGVCGERVARRSRS